MSRPLPRSGLGATDHDEPFHDSTNVVEAIPESDHPTAMHAEALEQKTESNCEFVPRAGLGTTDHAVPFHDSTNVALPPELPETPTATHESALGQDTENSKLLTPARFGLGTIVAEFTAAPADIGMSKEAARAIEATTAKLGRRFFKRDISNSTREQHKQNYDRM